MILELDLSIEDLFPLIVESVDIYTDKLNLDIKGFKDYMYNYYYNKIPKKVNIKEFNLDNKKYVINYKNNCDIDLDNLYYNNNYEYIKYNLYKDVDYKYFKNLGIQKLLTTPENLFFQLLNNNLIVRTGIYNIKIKIKDFITYKHFCVYYNLDHSKRIKQPIFTINNYDSKNNFKKLVKDKRIGSDPYINKNYKYNFYSE